MDRNTQCVVGTAEDMEVDGWSASSQSGLPNPGQHQICLRPLKHRVPASPEWCLIQHVWWAELYMANKLPGAADAADENTL